MKGQAQRVTSPEVEDAFAVVYYDLEGEFMGVTCGVHAADFEGSHNGIGDFETAEAIWSSGAENEAYCAVCGRRLDTRHFDLR